MELWAFILILVLSTAIVIYLAYIYYICNKEKDCTNNKRIQPSSQVNGKLYNTGRPMSSCHKTMHLPSSNQSSISSTTSSLSQTSRNEGKTTMRTINNGTYQCVSPNNYDRIQGSTSSQPTQNQYDMLYNYNRRTEQKSTASFCI